MTEQGRWPSATDYIDAVQYPSLVFSHGELKEARFDLDMYGIPDGCTGSNVIVFRAMLGPRTVALRCFTSQAGLSCERYLALARHVQADDRGARWLVPAGWRDDALRVKGQNWPLIEMEWVNGRPLDVYVGSLCQTQPSALPLLADRWRDMLADLAAAQVAHGDLQHGNVLVDQSSTALRLVDLDGAWVPGMQGLAAPAESGHQAFRHPNRAESDQWGPYMDTFPGLVVLVSLLALAHRPALWATYNNGDNLIFTADDFTSVDATALWGDLAKIDDRDLADLVLLLKQCCDPRWQPGATLDELIAEAPVSRPTAVEVATATKAQPEVAGQLTADATEPDPVESVAAAAAATALDDGLDWDVHVPLDTGPPARTVADPTMTFRVAAAASAEPASGTNSVEEAATADPDETVDTDVTAAVGAVAELEPEPPPAEQREPAAALAFAGVAPPPTATTALPPPPAVETATMHAPVENQVLVATTPAESSPGNPFDVPAMARVAGAAAPATTTRRPGTGRGHTMAPGYMGWTVLALVVGLVIVGLPALSLARGARRDEQAGRIEEASRRSYRARTVATVTVVCMAVVWLAVYAAATGT